MKTDGNILVNPKNNIIGIKLDRLIVLNQVEDGIRPSGKRYPCYECQCDCGKVEVKPDSYLLRKSAFKQCKTCAKSTASTKHGCARTSTYKIWTTMKSRCNNPNNDRFKHYGGRGVAVCEQWDNSFETFLADMGERPSDKHSIDRIDNNGNYEPFNCQWVYLDEDGNNIQMLHRQRTVYVNWKGKKYPLAKLCRKLGVDYNRTNARLRKGWTIEEAVVIPKVEQIRVKPEVVAYIKGLISSGNLNKSKSELARELGIPEASVQNICAGRSYKHIKAL